MSLILSRPRYYKVNTSRCNCILRIDRYQFCEINTTFCGSLTTKRSCQKQVNFSKGLFENSYRFSENLFPTDLKLDSFDFRFVKNWTWLQNIRWADVTAHLWSLPRCCCCCFYPPSNMAPSICCFRRLGVISVFHALTSSLGFVSLIVCNAIIRQEWTSTTILIINYDREVTYESYRTTILGKAAWLFKRGLWKRALAFYNCDLTDDF